MEKKTYTLGAYASTRNEKEVYCLSLSGTAEFVEKSSEKFNTDNDGDLLIEVEYPEITVEKISNFFEENAKDYSAEEKNKAIKLVERYEEDNTTDMDIVIELLDRVISKKAHKELIKEANKLGIKEKEIKG